jgi:RimJ/RimL family protein N-acetyltransferase
VDIRVGDLLLRPPERGDLSAVVAACCDSEIPRFIPFVPLPYSEQDGRSFLAEAERKWKGSDERTFAIVEHQSDRFLGVVTIRLRDGGSLGFWLSRDARGRGVMTEAVKAVVDWARDEHGIERFYITAHPDNVASQRVAEKGGICPTRNHPARAAVSGWHAQGRPLRAHMTSDECTPAGDRDTSACRRERHCPNASVSEQREGEPAQRDGQG